MIEVYTREKISREYNTGIKGKDTEVTTYTEKNFFFVEFIYTEKNFFTIHSLKICLKITLQNK